MFNFNHLMNYVVTVFCSLLTSCQRNAFEATFCAVQTLVLTLDSTKKRVFNSTTIIPMCSV